MSKLQPLIIDPEQWRPAGWQETGEAWTFAEIIKYHKGHVRSKWVTARGVVIEQHKNEKGELVGCPPKRRAGVEAIAANSALLRDCWCTPEIVWQVVEAFFGRPIKCDPFWNPWGTLHPESRLDGSLERDGFAVDSDGAPKYWSGSVGANGPHSSTAHTPEIPDDSDEEYKKGGFLRMCSEYGKTEQCAAVVPYRGDDNLWHHGMSADVILEFGRFNFEPPPGVTGSSNPGCTVVLLWLPERDCSAPARRLFEGGPFRFEIPWTTKHKRTGRRTRELLCRPGVAKVSEDNPLFDLGLAASEDA